MNKEGAVNYVLVVDVSDNNMLYYYCGYFKGCLPVNSTNYVDSMKIPFKDEAEELCKKINKEILPFKYHIEEHGYY